MTRSDVFSREGLHAYARGHGFTAVAAGNAWNRSQRDIQDRKANYQEEVTLEEFVAFCEELSGTNPPKEYGETLRDLLLEWVAHLTEGK